jgi:hypothetical protein
LEIGKGEVDFNEILRESKSENSALNGMIYGTRAINFDKIIAKYRYSIAKHKF